MRARRLIVSASYPPATARAGVAATEVGVSAGEKAAARVSGSCARRTSTSHAASNTSGLSRHACICSSNTDTQPRARAMCAALGAPCTAQLRRTLRHLVRRATCASERPQLRTYRRRCSTPPLPATRLWHTAPPSVQHTTSASHASPRCASSWLDASTLSAHVVRAQRRFSAGCVTAAAAAMRAFCSIILRSLDAYTRPSMPRMRR